MRLPTIIGIAVVSLIAVWYVAISPRVDLGVSRELVNTLTSSLEETKSELAIAETNLALEQEERKRAAKLLQQAEDARVAIRNKLQTIESNYDNYSPENKDDEATKCLYLKPPSDLRRMRF